MNDQKTLIQLKNIWRTYHSSWKKPLHVVQGVNLDIASQELVAIMGPSGAGKTTLLNIMSGLDSPTKGEVYFGGKPLHKMSETEVSLVRNQKIGLIFQFYNLLNDLTALENILLPYKIFPKLMGGFHSKKRAKELLDKVGLKDRQNHYPTQLSGGEMQRVAIARSLINNPEVLLCDEPTGNLDSANAQEIRELLKKLCEIENKTIIIVTHDEKVAQITNRVVYIEDGKIQSHNLSSESHYTYTQ